MCSISILNLTINMQTVQSGPEAVITVSDEKVKHLFVLWSYSRCGNSITGHVTE